jgi:hypothetical protein
LGKLVGNDTDFAFLLGLSRVATGGENCGDSGDYPDRSVLVGLSTIEVFMVEQKAKN